MRRDAYAGLNWLCGIVGLIGVWRTTHGAWPIFWTVVAGLHFIPGPQANQTQPRTKEQSE